MNDLKSQNLKASASEDKVEKDEDDENTLVLTLSKPVSYEGKEYKTVDLNGLENITTKDLKRARRMMNLAGSSLDVFAERSVEFATYMANIVTGLPVSFFDSLSAKDGMILKNMVVNFLY
ncbi:MAG: phage tail assembly protein [Clostridium sp.]|nr:phage tail assembly protein [Clostridium sp.]